jgi:hypothetical protein
MTETEPKADGATQRLKDPRHHRIPIRVSRDRHGRMGAAAPCRTCGIELRVNARFCDTCGLPIVPTNSTAEYKQVTVLVADVVGSMDIASAVDTERLREIMTELFNRSAAAPTDPGFVLHELPLLRLRALLASAHGDEVTYRDFVDRYRSMAATCGFEGHLAVANAMT